LSHDEKTAIIDANLKTISLSRQTQLLGISRSSIYYEPKERLHDKELMDKIDAIYTDYPFYGSRRIRNELDDRYSIRICREHTQRLMRLMGIEALHPKPKTSIGNKQHEKYPYLLKNIIAGYSNHIWGTDITYVKLKQGWAYLSAMLDWYSRYVVAWNISLSMETELCMETLDNALSIATPTIHNSDQGSQYTDKQYVSMLQESGISVSMDGRGRCMDNIFTERLWRTVKQENVYLMGYENISEARDGLNRYFTFYNNKRRHQSLGYKTPHEIYFSSINDTRM
jgi:putative transposase